MNHTIITLAALAVFTLGCIDTDDTLAATATDRARLPAAEVAATEDENPAGRVRAPKGVEERRLAVQTGGSGRRRLRCSGSAGDEATPPQPGSH